MSVNELITYFRNKKDIREVLHKLKESQGIEFHEKISNLTDTYCSMLMSGYT